MRCLDIVRMVVSPCSAHSFGFSVVWHDIVVVREVFMADCAFPVLLDNLSVQEFPHFCWRPEFSIPPWVMWILNAPYTKLYGTFLPSLSTATAED
jgi:hypothetical protein